MPKTKVEVYDKDQLIYPFIESDHVTFSNGMKITEMLDQSISMPKVTHEDSSFKVGVGDQDVSSAIVDSSVAEMTIKGQTYQNILPEPTLRNKMIGKSMQRLNEGYDNIEVVDGVSKSAILKGQTLVNIAKKQEKPFSHSADKVLQNNHLQLSHSLKANTTYTRYIHVSALDLGTTSNVVMYDALYGEDGSYSQYSYVVTSKGWIINTFTPKTTSINPYMINPDMNALSNGLIYIEIDKFMIIEGDYTNVDIPYFEGMQSVKMPVLTTTGKNLYSYGDLTINNPITNVWYYTNGKTSSFGSSCKRTDGGNWFYLEKGVYSYKSINENTLTDIVLVGEGETIYASVKEVPSGWYVFRFKTKPESVDYAKISQIQLEKGPNITTYEPFKSNILRTPEEVVLKGIGDVKDTLNCNTGEYAQRIKEVVLNGSEDWQGLSAVNGSDNLVRFYTGNGLGVVPSAIANFYCDKIKVVDNNKAGSNAECVFNNSTTGSFPNGIQFQVSKEKATTVAEWRSYLSTNPITIQYPVTTPIVKTVDLSSSGNWEKIVLNGSENWSMTSESSNNNAFFKGSNTVPNNVQINSSNVAQKVICDILTPFTQPQLCNKPNDNYGISLGWNNSDLCVRPKDFPLTNEGLTQWKQYLQQNPVTVWYQTTTTQDNSIREMLSFANGHLQVSSEAENSLLPSVQYEIPTKNSYHMDLMKTNTLYTMKAKSVSGTFTIDGTSYNVNANGTFTSPSSMTDKLLIMSNKTNEEVMLLEGNVIDKTIPYFKGIKSAFEGEDKIEVLSTGKNLFNVNLHSSITVREDGVYEINTSDWDRSNVLYTLKPNTTYTLSFYTDHSHCWTCIKINGNTTSLKINESYSKSFTTDGTGIVSLGVYANTEANVGITFMSIQLEENDLNTTHEPHKSNTTKIPLLSPLRSLPNGICDELIIDRLNHKAKLIQRIGYEVLNENTAFSSYPRMEKEKTLLFQTQNANPQGASTYCISDQFIHRSNLWESSYSDTEAIMIGGGRGANNGKRIDFRISKAKVSTNNVTILQDYLSKEPITVLYQLNIPIITEIDLEGYPYIYKDGHIFLNSDIAPTTQITYSINQAQQIESANENLQRHEKEISRLQKLIAQYIQVEYESTLLSLKL